MPIVVSVPVDIPATKSVSYDLLSAELSRYAQSIIDEMDESVDVVSSVNLMKHASFLEDVRTDMHEFVHEQFQHRVA